MQYSKAIFYLTSFKQDENADFLFNKVKYSPDMVICSVSKKKYMNRSSVFMKQKLQIHKIHEIF